MQGNYIAKGINMVLCTLMYIDGNIIITFYIIIYYVYYIQTIIATVTYELYNIYITILI